MTSFYRVSGGGNDFLALIEPSAEPATDEIRTWCRRGLSLGADGLFVLRRGPQGVVMTYFNADGRAAPLCLNGTRCAARLAFQLGWAEGSVDVETGAGCFRARSAAAHSVALELPRPGPPQELSLEAGGSCHRGWRVEAGVPHFILVWRGSLTSAPVEELGAELRRHPSFAPEGTNVDFVGFPDSHRLEIRTYERGVEGETLACGTGVLAAVATGLTLRSLKLPVSALTKGGFSLQVAAADSERWSLTGDARILTHGTLTPEASELPPPPRWS